MHKPTPFQKRILMEEVGVLPMSDSSSSSSGPTEQEQQTEEPEQQDFDVTQETSEFEMTTSDELEMPDVDINTDPYAKHSEEVELDEPSAESTMKVERIGAGLKKVSKASLELENAMAILKSERSDYSRGKALVDIRHELLSIITQIKTELINMADDEPGLATKVRDIINNI